MALSQMVLRMGHIGQNLNVCQGHNKRLKSLLTLQLNFILTHQTCEMAVTYGIIYDCIAYSNFVCCQNKLFEEQFSINMVKSSSLVIWFTKSQLLNGLIYCFIFVSSYLNILACTNLWYNMNHCLLSLTVSNDGTDQVYFAHFLGALYGV